MVKKEVHIIGAGCAGLSLAKYLSATNNSDEYEIKFYGQKSKAFDNPHYWSFWGDQISLPVSQAIKKNGINGKLYVESL